MINTDSSLASVLAPVFDRAALYLLQHYPNITVHTADHATPQSPWYLAWADWGNLRVLVIGRSIGTADEWHEWADAEPEVLLATLGQLPELLARAQQAGQVLARLSLPARVAEAVAEVERALSLAKESR
jgi:hypothetical protein